MAKTRNFHQEIKTIGMMRAKTINSEEIIQALHRDSPKKDKDSWNDTKDSRKDENKRENKSKDRETNLDSRTIREFKELFIKECKKKNY